MHVNSQETMAFWFSKDPGLAVPLVWLPIVELKEDDFLRKHPANEESYRRLKIEQNPGKKPGEQTETVYGAYRIRGKEESRPAAADAAKSAAAPPSETASNKSGK